MHARWGRGQFFFMLDVGLLWQAKTFLELGCRLRLSLPVFLLLSLLHRALWSFSPPPSPKFLPFFSQRASFPEDPEDSHWAGSNSHFIPHCFFWACQKAWCVRSTQLTCIKWIYVCRRGEDWLRHCGWSWANPTHPLENKLQGHALQNQDQCPIPQSLCILSNHTNGWKLFSTLQHQYQHGYLIWSSLYM